jgi:hypothetical protein
MALFGKHPLLAHIEQGDLAAVREHRADLLRRQARHAAAGVETGNSALFAARRHSSFSRRDPPAAQS